MIESLLDHRKAVLISGAMTTGGMAQHGLLKYGDKALGPLLAQLKSLQTGRIKDVKVIGEHPLFVEATLEALKELEICGE